MNPWKLSDEDRECYREMLEVTADKLRAIRDAPGFVRPDPYCTADITIMCQEAGEVEVGMIFALVTLLIDEGEHARDHLLDAVTDVAAEYAPEDEPIDFDPRRN